MGYTITSQTDEGDFTDCWIEMSTGEGTMAERVLDDVYYRYPIAFAADEVQLNAEIDRAFNVTFPS